MIVSMMSKAAIFALLLLTALVWIFANDPHSQILATGIMLLAVPAIAVLIMVNWVGSLSGFFFDRLTRSKASKR